MNITSLRNRYRSGELNPVDLVDSIYDRIEAQPLNPIWITLVPREEAISFAKKLTNMDLPLYGVPFAIKDNIDAAGCATTAGCPAYAYTPSVDASVVSRLKAAGAILIGKTNLDQFATGLVGTRSPYGACSSVFDPKFISGGSSSGSAVALASGLVTFALGTDTAGSGRVPAAFNNIVGVKPSRGLISASGVVPACRSLDCVSIFALNCADGRAILDVAAASDPTDPFSREHNPATLPPGPLRIGVPKELEFFGDIEYQRLYAEALNSLKTAGHTLVEIDFTPFKATAELLYAGPYVAERYAAVGEFVSTHLDAVDATVGAIVTGSTKWTAVDAYNSLYKLKALEKQTAAIWKSMDVMVLPTAPTTYTIEQVQKDPIKLNSNLGYYTNFVNLLDLSAVAVPAGFTKGGFPFGVTFIGPTFSDRSLLAFAGLMGTSKYILLSVVGAHLTGQPLNHQLTDRGARLVRTTKTAKDYRCFALQTKPPKPGLIKTPGVEGPGFETEIWEIPDSQFGSFVAGVPAPLSIGTCELMDGSSVKGFVCEPYAIEGMPDITKFGGWRTYLERATGIEPV